MENVWIWYEDRLGRVFTRASMRQLRAHVDMRSQDILDHSFSGHP